MVAINKKIVRPIDNIIYWSKVCHLLIRSMTYYLLSKLTTKSIIKISLKDDVGDDFLSDKRYVGSKNTVTCAAMGHI